MKYFTSLFFVLTFAAILTAQDGSTFTLSQAVDYALKNSNNMKQANLDIAAAAAQIKEYKAIGMPSVKGEVGYTYLYNPFNFSNGFTSGIVQYLKAVDPVTFAGVPIPPVTSSKIQFNPKNNFAAGVSFSQLIFDGSYIQGMKAIKGYKTLTETKTGINKQEVVYSVTKAYYNVLAAKVGLGVIENNIANLNKVLADTKAFYKAGFVEQLDIDRLELSLQNLNMERDGLLRNIDMATNYLKFTMSYPVEKPIEISDTIENLIGVPSDNDMNGSISFADRVEYAILQQQIALNEMNITRFKKSYLPSLVGFGNLKESLGRNNIFGSDEGGIVTNVTLGLTLAVPIYDGGDRKAKIQKATIDTERIKLQKNDFERGMTLQVMNARIAYLNAQERLAARQKTLALAEKIYNVVKVKIKEGVSNSFELTSAEREMYSAQGGILSATKDILDAKADLDKALGKMGN